MSVGIPHYQPLSQAKCPMTPPAPAATCNRWGESTREVVERAIAQSKDAGKWRTTQ